MKKLIIIPLLFLFVSGFSQQVDSLIGIVNGHPGKLIKDTAVTIKTNYITSPTSTSLGFDSTLVITNVTKNATRDSFQFRNGAGNIVVTLKDSVGSGGGGTAEVAQTLTTSGTVSNTTTVLYINPTTTAATLTVTMPASPTNLQRVEMEFGGSVSSGNVVTALTVSPNTGQTILQASTPTSVAAGEVISYRYDSVNAIWHRIN